MSESKLINHYGFCLKTRGGKLHYFLSVTAFLINIIVFLCPTNARAEILGGIEYMMTLGQIKKIYPNAEYSKQVPAWLTEDEAFYKITGSGMTVEYRVSFVDVRQLYKKVLLNPSSNLDQDVLEAYQRAQLASDDDALRAQWVRMVHVTPVPLERYKAKYGKPKCLYDKEMQFLCEWESLALTATMSDDEKSVITLTTSFSKKDIERSNRKMAVNN